MKWEMCYFEIFFLFLWLNVKVLNISFSISDFNLMKTEHLWSVYFFIIVVVFNILILIKLTLYFTKQTSTLVQKTCYLNFWKCNAR